MTAVLIRCVLLILRRLGKVAGVALLALGGAILCCGVAMRLAVWMQVPLERPLAYLLTNTLEQSVAVASARLEWQGVWPALELRDVQLGQGNNRLELGQMAISLGRLPGAQDGAGPYGIGVYIRDVVTEVIQDARRGWSVGGWSELDGGGGALPVPVYVQLSGGKVRIERMDMPQYTVSGIDLRLLYEQRRLRAGGKIAGGPHGLAAGSSFVAAARQGDWASAEAFLSLEEVDIQPLAGLMGMGGVSGQLSGKIWPVLEIQAGQDAFALSTIKALYGALQLADAGVDARNGLPGAGSVNAALAFHGRRFTAKADLHDTELELPQILSKPLRVNRAAARFRGGLFIDGGWWLALHEGMFSNDIITQGFKGRLDYVPGQGLELLFFAALLEPARVAELVEYIPPRITPAPVHDWIEMAMRAGRLEGAQILFQGDPRDYPFTEQSGVLQVNSQFRDAELLYLRDWPLIRDLDADLRINNTSLTVDGHSATTCGAELHDVDLRIDDLRRPVIDLSGKARGDAQHGICFLRQAPVGPGFVSDPPAPFKVDGPLAMGLDLWLPLSTKVKEKGHYRSRIDLLGVNFSLDPHLNLEAISGSLEFDNQGIRDLDLQGDWGGERFTASAGMAMREGRNRTVGEILAYGSPDSLIGSIERDDLPWIGGKTSWRLGFVLPTFKPASTDPQGELFLSSSLRGLEIDMPAPFGLAQEQVRDLRLDLTLTEIGPESYSLSYGDVLSGLAVAPQGGLPQALGVRIGGGGDKQSLPVAGVQVSGRLPELNIDKWLLWFDRNVMADSAEPQGREAGDLPVYAEMLRFAPVDLDLQFGKLILQGRDYGVQRLAAGVEKQGRGWLELEGDLATGEVLWREGGSDIRADFGHIDLPLSGQQTGAKQSGTEQSDTKPAQTQSDLSSREEPLFTPQSARRWPRIEGQVDSLRFDGRHAGKLQLTLRQGKGEDHLVAGKATLRGQVLEAQMEAYWRERCNRAGNTQCTEFEAVMLSPDVAALLGLFGGPAAVTRAGVELNTDGVWPGSPLDFNLAALRGDVGLSMSDGRITEINPGAGRLVGLFGLRMLPRRIFLDFGDMFGDGLAFESIDGKFRLAGDGSASVERMHIDSSIAQVDMFGSVNYIKRSYDAQVWVTPRIGATLPVIGLLFGGGVGGALGIMADWVVGGSVDKAVAIVYRVSGPWNNPKVTRTRP